MILDVSAMEGSLGVFSFKIGDRITIEVNKGGSIIPGVIIVGGK